MIVLGLAFLQIPRSHAQVGSGPIWVVRSLSTAEYGMQDAKGLAFSQDTSTFIVLDGGARATLITMYEDHAGTLDVPEAQGDALNAAFDQNGLFVFKRDQSELVRMSLQGSGASALTPSSRFGVGALGVSDPQGITFDPAGGTLFILDVASAEIVSMAPDSSLGFDAQEAIRAGRSQRISLADHGFGLLRGIAYNPGNGHLYVSEPGANRLHELGMDGSLISTFDLGALGIQNPMAMTFAPSVDNTDDPAIHDLFILDAGTPQTARRSAPPARAVPAQQASSPGSQIVEVSLIEPAALPGGTPLLPATLVQIIDTSNAAWNPSSPDPAGIDWWPANQTLLISDSEVNEMPPYWQGSNIFESTTSGTLVDTCSTTSYTNEPTGVAINPNNNHIFISSDAGSNDKVFEIDLGPDNTYCTADDTITITNVASLYGATDVEDVAYGDNTLFIADGVNAEVYRVPLGANGELGGGDDGAMTHFDTASLGFSDMEALGYNTDSGTLFIASPKGRERYLGETTHFGVLVNAYDLALMGGQGNIRSDVTYAPGSQNPGIKNIYIASRGVDNNNDPNENDGRIWEINIAGFGTSTPSQTATQTNTPAPTATATATGTATWTPTATDTPTATATPLPTNTPTHTPTTGPSPTPTNTPTASATSPATATFTATPVPQGPVTFTPVADAFIHGSNPSNNYGSDPGLEVDGRPEKHFLLKYVVTGVGGSQVTSATLRLYNTNSSNYGGDFHHAADDNWQEGSVTWSNAPSEDPTPLGSLGAVSPGNFYDVDLSALIQGDGTYTIRVLPGTNNGADYSSKEGAEPPVLILELSGPPGPSPTPTATATFTATPTATFTATPTVTASATATPTDTATPTATFTATNTPTVGPSPTPSHTPTASPTASATHTATATATATSTPVPTATFTPSPTSTATSTPTPGAGGSLTFFSEADSQVKEAQPDNNYGTALKMWTQGDTDPNSEAYIQFTVSGITAPVQSAILRVYANSATVDGPGAFAVDNTWTELGITWNNRPALTSALLQEQAEIPRNTWIEYDVTLAVNGNGVYSFVLISTHVDSVSFSSREGSDRPELLVTFGP